MSQPQQRRRGQRAVADPRAGIGARAGLQRRPAAVDEDPGDVRQHRPRECGGVAGELESDAAQLRRPDPCRLPIRRSNPHRPTPRATGAAAANARLRPRRASRPREAPGPTPTAADAKPSGSEAERRRKFPPASHDEISPPSKPEAPKPSGGTGGRSTVSVDAQDVLPRGRASGSARSRRARSGTAKEDRPGSVGAAIKTFPTPGEASPIRARCRARLSTSVGDLGECGDLQLETAGGRRVTEGIGRSPRAGESDDLRVPPSQELPARPEERLQRKAAAPASSASVLGEEALVPAAVHADERPVELLAGERAGPCATGGVAGDVLEKGGTAFLQNVARDAPPGAWPRSFVGQGLYWAPVGVDGSRDEGLLSEDGALETGRGGFSLEPFVWTGGKLLGWSDAEESHALEHGDVPIPSVKRRYPGGLELEVTAVADGPRRVRRFGRDTACAMRAPRPWSESSSSPCGRSRSIPLRSS